LKVQLDENLPPALARALNALAAADDHEVIHVTDYAKGASDTDLFRRAIANGVKVHITLDNHYRHPAERAAITRLGLTVFVLAKGWSTMNHYDKAARLIEYWPSIMTTAGLVAPGSIFRVPHRRKGRMETIKGR
jgi:hypothetical protein